MDPNTDARTIAARVLSELERREAYADALLDSFLTKAGGDRRDRGLATALVYGVLRWRLTLDRHLEAAAGRRVGKIHPKVLNILRVAAFQLLHLDRIPAAAAVDSAVRAVRSGGQGHAAGFANAVLRRVADRARAPEPADAIDAFSLEFSLPQWLAAEWVEREGVERARRLAENSLAEPPLFLRVDTSRLPLPEALKVLRESGRDSGAGKFAPESVWLTGGGDPRSLPPVAGKRAVVQGQASQLIAPLLDAEPGMTVLDACAAPGMKTLHLARLMEGKGRIVALDLHSHRAERVRDAAADHGFTNIMAVAADASAYEGGPFDRALVDAPCTGLGVLARNPERKWRLAPEDPARMAKLQGAILSNVGRLVRPGGLLLYSTCSTSPEENEGVVEGFLRENEAFEPDNPALPEGLSDREGNLRTYPAAGADPSEHLDGFFAARFRRRTS